MSQTLILADCLATAASQMFQVIDRRKLIILSVHLCLYSTLTMAESVARFACNQRDMWILQEAQLSSGVEPLRILGATVPIPSQNPTTVWSQPILLPGPGIPRSTHRNHSMCIKSLLLFVLDYNNCLQQNSRTPSSPNANRKDLHWMTDFEVHSKMTKIFASRSHVT